MTKPFCIFFFLFSKWHKVSINTSSSIFFRTFYNLIIGHPYRAQLFRRAKKKFPFNIHVQSLLTFRWTHRSSKEQCVAVRIVRALTIRRFAL